VEKVVLVIHLVIALAMVIVVLLQRSEGAGLVGPSSGGMMPVRGSGNILTRTTAILATLFFITSLTLAVMAGGHKRSASIADQLANQPTQEAPLAPPTGEAAPAAPVTAPATPAPVAPTP
jgi:preprotein translocase subunit SecG